MSKDIDTLIEVIRKLEKKLPRVPHNDFWKGYREALGDLWQEVERLS